MAVVFVVDGAEIVNQAILLTVCSNRYILKSSAELRLRLRASSGSGRTKKQKNKKTKKNNTKRDQGREKKMYLTR